MPQDNAIENSNETVELEITEDQIVGYIVDEDDNEIGLIYTDENGEEQELLYDEVDSIESEEVIETEEVEIDADSILYYLVTPDGREIGLVAQTEDGEKQELLYAEEEIDRFFLLKELDAKLKKATSVKGAAGNIVSTGASTVGGVVNGIAGKEVIKGAGNKPAKTADDEDDGVSKDDLKDMFGTFKDVAVEGYAALSGVLDQVDDVRDQLDDINPKKRRAKRRTERAQMKAAEAQAAAAAKIQQQQATEAGTVAATTGTSLPPLNVKRAVEPAAAEATTADATAAATPTPATAEPTPTATVEE